MNTKFDDLFVCANASENLENFALWVLNQCQISIFEERFSDNYLDGVYWTGQFDDKHMRISIADDANLDGSYFWISISTHHGTRNVSDSTLHQLILERLENSKRIFLKEVNGVKS
jgi:hypothetical protein